MLSMADELGDVSVCDMVLFFKQAQPPGFGFGNADLVAFRGMGRGITNGLFLNIIFMLDFKHCVCYYAYVLCQRYCFTFLPICAWVWCLSRTRA